MKTDAPQSSLSYQDAGVDIEKGNRFVDAIKTAAKRTHTNAVLSGIGGFAACFELDLSEFKQPILCACTDGVGTKLKLAHALNDHRGIGIDCVAMCANDLIVGGAKPLFFLDYYATGQLDLTQGQWVIEGIAKGCELAGMSLIGGETAEMPGVYAGSEYDIAGFSVGVVDKHKRIDGSRVAPGDVVLGLQSSGLHSNGFSLIRKLIEQNDIDLNTPLDKQNLGQVLLTPTRIYVASLLPLMADDLIHAAAHITGGGIAENLARVLPTSVSAHIDANSWQKPAIYAWLDSYPQIEHEQRLRTFNEGLGMIVCVSKDNAAQITARLQASGETVFTLGQIKVRAAHEVAVVID